MNALFFWDAKSWTENCLVIGMGLEPTINECMAQFKDYVTECGIKPDDVIWADVTRLNEKNPNKPIYIGSLRMVGDDVGMGWNPTAEKYHNPFRHVWKWIAVWKFKCRKARLKGI